MWKKKKKINFKIWWTDLTNRKCNDGDLFILVYNSRVAGRQCVNQTVSRVRNISFGKGSVWSQFYDILKSWFFFFFFNWNKL